MKFLITGVPGWLGSRFLDSMVGDITELTSLSENIDISSIRCLVQPGLKMNVSDKYKEFVEVIEGDITYPDSLSDFFINSQDSILFHLAGIIHPTRGVKQLDLINRIGTENVLDKAIRNNVKRIVAISSNSPIGTNKDKDLLFNEESTYNPYLAYGKSKMELEKCIIRSYNANLIETVILRPCWFYGPGQPARQSLFFSMVKDGKAPIVGNGENMRSMSYIDNICQALLLSSKSDKANGEIYWIADEKPYSWNKIIDTVEYLIENEFGYEVAHKRLKLPNFSSKIAYGVDFLLQSVNMYHQKIHVLSEMNKTIACSIEKAKKDLGYTPTIMLKEGMKRSIKWMLNNGQKL